MAIVMYYECRECDSNLTTLDDAQAHANAKGHVVEIGGTLTSNVVVIDAVAIERAARERALEAAILRAARDKNLLPKGTKA